MKPARQMLTFFVFVEAKLGDTLVSDPAGQPILGYFQTIGITARDEVELVSLVKEHLQSDLGSQLIEIDKMWVPDFEGEDSDIKGLIGNVNKIGIWYTSGKAFYGPEEDE